MVEDTKLKQGDLKYGLKGVGFNRFRIKIRFRWRLRTHAKAYIVALWTVDLACLPKPWRRKGPCMPAEALAKAGTLHACRSLGVGRNRACLPKPWRRQEPCMPAEALA